MSGVLSFRGARLHCQRSQLRCDPLSRWDEPSVLLLALQELRHTVENSEKGTSPVSRSRTRKKIRGVKIIRGKFVTTLLRFIFSVRALLRLLMPLVTYAGNSSFFSCGSRSRAKRILRFFHYEEVPEGGLGSKKWREANYCLLSQECDVIIETTFFSIIFLIISLLHSIPVSLAGGMTPTATWSMVRTVRSSRPFWRARPSSMCSTRIYAGSWKDGK